MSDNVVVSFGEVMGRLAVPNCGRLLQGLPGPLHYTFAGAEANVAASVAMLGGNSRFVTALPQHELGEACIHSLRAVGIDTRYILRSQGRLGTYYIETGANQRPSKVIYDREHSAISLIAHSAFDWSAIFAGASWLHISGITPALSALSAANTLAVARMAAEGGLTVSCDLNFRGKLWQWQEGVSARELARQTMPEILQYVDVIIANEEDAADVLGIHAPDSDVASGKLALAGYIKVAEQIAQRFAKVKKVAITLRESVSASHNNWGAMLYDVAGQAQTHVAPQAEDGSYAPYQIRNIVDRVGGGDSFAAGLIFALNSAGYSAAESLRFAVAASCLCHSIHGDFNYSSRAEVERLMGGNTSGRVVR